MHVLLLFPNPFWKTRQTLCPSPLDPSNLVSREPCLSTITTSSSPSLQTALPTPSIMQEGNWSEKQLHCIWTAHPLSPFLILYLSPPWHRVLRRSLLHTPTASSLTGVKNLRSGKPRPVSFSNWLYSLEPPGTFIDSSIVHYQATQSPRLPVVSDLGTRARPNRKRVVSWLKHHNKDPAHW